MFVLSKIIENIVVICLRFFNQIECVLLFENNEYLPTKYIQLN